METTTRFICKFVQTACENIEIGRENVKNKLKQTIVGIGVVGVLAFGIATTTGNKQNIEIPTGELPTVVKIGTSFENAQNFMEFRRVQKEQEIRQIRIASRGNNAYFRLSESERRIAECIVQGEAGGEDFTGKCLVAQCLVNACIESNIQPSQAKKQLKYSGWSTSVSDETRLAVREVFDNGYQVVPEQILYFYAPKHCKGKWHETQTFVIEHGGHKFFARKQ